MTRAEAKRALETTWCFEQVEGKIALRDTALIDAVRAYQAEQPAHSPTSARYSEGAALRPS